MTLNSDPKLFLHLFFSTFIFPSFFLQECFMWFSYVTKNLPPLFDLCFLVPKLQFPIVQVWTVCANKARPEKTFFHSFNLSFTRLVVTWARKCLEKEKVQKESQNRKYKKETQRTTERKTRRNEDRVSGKIGCVKQVGGKEEMGRKWNDCFENREYEEEIWRERERERWERVRKLNDEERRRNEEETKRRREEKKR